MKETVKLSQSVFWRTVSGALRLAGGLLQELGVRVALPVWAGRLSPVFDVAKRFVLVDLSGAETTREEERLLEMPDRVSALAEDGVELVICGAISKELERRLLASGVDVIRDVRGAVGDVLGCFVGGTLLERSHWMPGCKGRHLRC